KKRVMSGAPMGVRGVWQSGQAMTLLTRYFPRACIGVSAPSLGASLASVLVPSDVEPSDPLSDPLLTSALADPSSLLPPPPSILPPPLPPAPPSGAGVPGSSSFVHPLKATNPRLTIHTAVRFVIARASPS